MSGKIEELKMFTSETIREMIDHIKIGEVAEKAINRSCEKATLHSGKQIFQMNNKREERAMHKKILVCLDGSKLSEQILPYVLDEAVRLQHKLVFLRAIPRPVIDRPPIPGDSMEDESLVIEARREYSDAKAYLEEFANLFRNYGVEVDTVIVGEKAGVSIVAFADNHNIDLVAMTTHGYTGLKRYLLGSTANYVINESGIPVLLIKPTKVLLKPLYYYETATDIKHKMVEYVGVS